MFLTCCGPTELFASGQAELETVRLVAARTTMPIKHTIQLAFDQPLAFANLKTSYVPQRSSFS